MKIERSKSWWEKRARAEGDHRIGFGNHSLWSHLTGSAPISGPAGYQRGAEAARNLLARSPPASELKTWWNYTVSPLDDYDRGVHDALVAAGVSFDEEPQ